MLSLGLSLPHFPITITAETSLSHPVIFDREETCLEGKEGSCHVAICMNYSSGCFYLGVYLEKHRNYWVLNTSQNAYSSRGYC